MKLKSFFILLTFVIFLNSSLVNTLPTPEEDEAQNEMMAKLFYDMGLDKSDDMTRENLRTLLEKLLTGMSTEKYSEHSSFLKKIIEKYTMEVPEVFPRIDIAKYLSQERIMSILQESVKEEYGEKYVEDLKPAFESMANIGDNEGEGQSPNQEKEVEL